MALRVVVYGEGGGEVSGTTILPRTPGKALSEPELGPAHHLVRRCIEAQKDSVGEIVFEAPLRYGPRMARGSDFLDKKRLRQLLTWIQSDKRPDLAVVLVDCDGDNQRRQSLRGFIEDLPVRSIVGVAIQEFEAWLIADHKSVGEVLGQVPSAPPAPEGMKPGVAKNLLRTWIHEISSRALSSGAIEKQIRIGIARKCDLDVLYRTCRSFEQFVKQFD